MLLQKKEDGTIVEIMDIQELIGPTHDEIVIRIQEGQEEQEPETIKKQNLVFPSGESLPLCWLDADYRNKN